MWNEFGFTRNLYDTHPVKGDAVGERLLVGRERELKVLKNRISNINSVVTVEGPNGVGKTSLVLVAGYKLENETSAKGKNSLILLREPFQFTAEETAVDFKRKVYAGVASHFIKNEKELRTRLDIQFNLKPLEIWLENPLMLSGGITIAGSGLNGGKSVNDASGFDHHGFFALVDRLLSAAFREDGGVICTLDNLEILDTSQVARQRLEALRDDLFNKAGLRWVVCGARGIVRSVADSGRLQGRLQEPLEVAPLPKEAIEALISTRSREYALSQQSVPPVGFRSFMHIFEVLNENLRDALKFSGDFSVWLYENGQFKPEPEHLHEMFEVWLAESSDAYLQAIKIPPRAWQLFDDICEHGGSFSPSDYANFGFNSQQHMRGEVTKLEQTRLVSSEIDESDHRRKIVNVTAKGWLLRHQRSGYKKKGSKP